MAPLASLSNLKRPDLFQQKGFIAESWVDSVSGSTFDVVNPATLETIATLPEMNATDTAKAVTAAHEAFKSYKKTSARQRARWLRQWYALCMEHLEDLALVLTLENGKPLAEAKGEVIYAASFLDWFAAEAERTHGEVVPTANLGQRILTIKEPIGVAACLVPCNFPIAMITRKVGAAALAQALLAQEVGFPKGTVNVVTTLNNVAEVGEALCKSKLIRKLSFTGSTRVGKILVEQSSANLTKLSLELGGNSPFIVFDDAKVETAVDAYATSRGASVLLGGAMSMESLTTTEEVFAPVGALFPFKTEEEVIEKANDCDVGLGSFIITESISRMWRVAESLEVGMVGVNLGMLSACESPFGGVKESGYGREGGRHGIYEYLTVKSILINVLS
ncbi:hypothetical protein SI65_02861 [Aspergillus cristatus]|uniref:Aldehyde dehydrogenase domain-containing protein n=1 Tax=Aspergillus cristatus TaxID=573508 RepID=A0A1E3BM97_ASPCR|nr:hypothetical protein SI65_02861 [Aspergillus cristatus]